MVNTHSESEEQLLIAFLASHRFDYKSGLNNHDTEAFLDQYNKDIDEAEADIDIGNFMTQNEVEKLFSERRKSL